MAWENEIADWPATRDNWCMWKPYGGVRWDRMKMTLTLAAADDHALIIRTIPRLAAFRRTWRHGLMPVEPVTGLGLRSIIRAATPSVQGQLLFPFCSERLACTEFLCAVGVDLITLKIIETFDEDIHFSLLRAASSITDFARLLLNAPALATIVADPRIGKATWGVRRTLPTRKYRDILGLLGFRNVSPKCISKITDRPSISRKRLLALRHVAATEYKLVRSLGHVPRIVRHLLDVLVALKEHPEVLRWIGPSLFASVAHTESLDFSPALVLTEIACHGGRLRVDPEPLGSVVDLQCMDQRLRKRRRRKTVLAMPFPNGPAIPRLRSKHVTLRALRTPHQLVLHSEAQQVCAADYVQEVASGRMYFFAGMTSEGTITVRLSRNCHGAWHVTAIRGYRNRRVSTTVTGCIVRWIATSQGLDDGRTLERFHTF